MKNLNKIEKLLLMAALYHDLTPNANIGPTTYKVISRTMIWADFSGEEILQKIHDYDYWTDNLDLVYQTLLNMTSSNSQSADNAILRSPKKSGEILFNGYGNWGDYEDKVAAHPCFNAIRLTEYGLEVAKELLIDFPQFKKPS